MLIDARLKKQHEQAQAVAEGGADQALLAMGLYGMRSARANFTQGCADLGGWSAIILISTKAPHAQGLSADTDGLQMLKPSMGWCLGGDFYSTPDFRDGEQLYPGDPPSGLNPVDVMTPALHTRLATSRLHRPAGHQAWDQPGHHAPLLHAPGTNLTTSCAL